MRLSKEDVLRVAELAHLELTGAEVETYRAQLNSILEYIGKLNELDTATVEPMAGGRPAGVGGDADPMRGDVEQPRDVMGDVMRHAPDASPDGRFIRVPKVIER
jgi:aspartyl-tRNA(Asn)/glutamyl-tRNA(Gln) amidotransferase subunit C